MFPVLLACATPEGPLPLRILPGTITRGQADAGLRWSMAHLGFDEAVVGEDFTVDWPADPALVAPLLASEEVREMGGMDVGRFLMLTLYSPGRYYAATGACATLEAWRATHTTDATYAVSVSQLVEEPRTVEYRVTPGEASEIAFAISEAPGEVETVDVMPNGRQRFAVYGPDGALRAAAETTPAGQPGRCMWCHEGRLQHGSPENPGQAEFVAQLDAIEVLMLERAGSLTTDDHVLSEKLVLDFLEPTPERAAAEGVAADLPTHVNEEHPDDGPRYWRADVDALLPFDPLPTAATSREADPASTLEGAEDLPPCVP